MDIYLDGKLYVLSPGTEVVRRTHEEWAPQYRTTGLRRRDNLEDISTWEMREYTAGFGIYRMDVSNSRDLVSFWDSELNTFWPGQVTLPPLRHVTSFSPMSFNVASGYGMCGTESYPPRKIINDGGYLWAIPTKGHIATSNGSGVTTQIATYKYSGGGWVGSRNEFWDGVAKFDITVLDETKYRGQSHVICKVGTTSGNPAPTGGYSLRIGYATLAGVYTHRAQVSTNVPDVVLSIAFSDGNIYVFAYENTTKLLRVHTAGSNYSFTEKFNIGVPFAPTGVAEYLNYDGAAAIFLCFQDYLYQVDLTNNDLLPRIDMTSFTHSKNGVGMRVHQGKLIIPTKRDMIAYNYTGTYEPIGLNLDSGLPSKKRGDHSALDVTPDFLIQAIQAEEACIYGLHDGGWHFVTKGAVASQAISPMAIGAKDDDVQRVHWIGGTLPYFVEHPFENPLQISGATFMTEGKLTLSQYDDGMPEMKGGFYTLFVEGEQLSALQRIQALYGFNGAAPTQELGVATAGNRELKFNNGVGTEAYIIQPQFNLLRGTLTGTTPVLRTQVLKFLKRPDIREYFELTIDTNLTARARRGRESSENIIREVGSLTQSRIQLPFKYGMIPTKLVLVKESPASERDTAKGFLPLDQNRVGLISLRLMEILAS